MSNICIRLLLDDAEGIVREWTIGQDVRESFRLFQRRPAFPAAVVPVLALAIATTTATFAVVKNVLLDPLPYPTAGALVRIVHNIGGIEQSYFNDAIVTTYVANTHAFSLFGVWTPPDSVTITGDGEPEEIRALTVSRGLLETLGVQPAIGRWFSARDDSPGSGDTAIIGAGLWQRKYGGDAGAVGRTITVNARPHLIIGVMPAQFAFRGEFDILLPLRIDPARPIPFFRLNGVARMKPGITLAQANADVARMLEVYFDTFRANTDRAVRWIPSLVPLKQNVIGDAGQTLWVLLGTAGFVLLMACANLANLFLVRVRSRHSEVAIRVALGAKSSRLARALLTECMLLAALAGAAGIALAAGGLRALTAVAPAALPRLSEITLDPMVVLFALGITVACGAVVSVLPVVKAIGIPASSMIGAGARSAGGTRDQQRSQNVLVALQIAFAVLLMVAAGLMIRSVQALHRVDPGFEAPETLLTFDISIPPTVEPDLDRLTRMQQAILDSVSALPGVTSTAFTTRLPLDASRRWSAALAAEDKPIDGRTTPPNRHLKVVSPGSFRTFGTPVLAGRDFEWTDLYERREVAIVSANLARDMWGSPEAALGKRIRQHYGPKGPWCEIVGVVGDVHDDGVHLRPPATVYWPARLDAQLFAGYQPRRVSVTIRTSRAGTSAVVAELRQAVWSVNPNLPLARVGTLHELYRHSMSRASFTLTAMTIAGVLASLLAACGVYGVIMHAVTERGREIGIRMALGAQARHITALFLVRGLTVVVAGLTVGVIGAAAFTRLMTSMLFGVDPLDPGTYIWMSTALAAGALLAIYLPTRRALSIDPAETMRAE